MTEITKERRDALSRIVEEVRRTYDAHAVNAGTDARARDFIYKHGLALLDALDAAEAKMGVGPVAWQHRGPRGGWITTDEKTKWSERPLYAAPPAAEPVIPEGWKLVPVAPTEGMIEAAAPHAGRNVLYSDIDKAKRVISAGIAAAPALTTSQEPSHE